MNSFLKKVLVLLFSLRLRILLNRKILRIAKNVSGYSKVSKREVLNYFKFWEGLKMRPNPKWFKVFTAINGIEDPRYVSEYDYYRNIEPRLNHKGFCEAYSDKNSYSRFFAQELLPVVYLRNIYGQFYTQDYQSIDRAEAFNLIPDFIDKIIVKMAVDSGGGRGIELFEKHSGEWVNNKKVKLTLHYLDLYFKTDYIIQEFIDQHIYYKQFNVSSVNTVRVFTYRSVVNNEVIPLQAVLRIGKPGSFVDNQASGGIACGINDNGKLNSFAVNKRGDKISSFNGVVFKDVAPVFMFDEIKKTSVILARSFFYQRLLGFDFSVDYHGNVKLIEVNNNNNETNFFQMSNGPLFREYTEEIITFCNNKEMSFNFDFFHK